MTGRLLRLGTAPDSWGVWFADDPRQTPWRRYLDEAAAAAYTATELGPYGYLPTSTEVLGTELRARGLQLTGGVVMRPLHPPAAWAEMRDEVARQAELIGSLGGTHLVVIHDFYRDVFTGERIGPADLHRDDWERSIDCIHAIARQGATAGLRTALHPHAHTPMESEPQIERALADTDPALVDLCLDVGHHAFVGSDPVPFLRRHASRLRYVHLKNVDATVLAGVRRDDASFGEATARGVFTELDRGLVDIASVVRTVREIGFDGWAIVEQDLYPVDFDRPAAIAERNLAYLQGLSD